MRKFSSIAFQLFGFLALAVLTIGLFFALSLSYNIQARNLLEAARKDSWVLNQIKEIRYHFSFARKEEKNWVLFKNPNYLESRKKSLTRTQSLMIDLKNRVKKPELVEPLESLESHMLHYAALGSELETLNTIKAIANFTKKAKVIDEDITTQVGDITNLIFQSLNAQQEEATKAFQTYFQWSILILGLGLAFFIGAGLVWIARFQKRLKKLTQATRIMALGDYFPQLEAFYSDELGILAANFNEMAVKIATREEKINQITQELIQANNLLKKGTTPLHQIPKVRI